MNNLNDQSLDVVTINCLLFDIKIEVIAFLWIGIFLLEISFFTKLDMLIFPLWCELIKILPIESKSVGQDLKEIV